MSGELTPRQRQWLEMVVDYVAEGDSSNGARAAKGWLRPLGGGPDQRQTGFDALVARGVFDPDEFLTLRRLRVPLLFSAETLAASEAEELAHTLRR